MASVSSSGFYVVLIAVVLFVTSCANPNADQSEVNELKQADDFNSNSRNEISESNLLEVDVVIVNKARDPALLEEVLSGVNDIYRQCRIEMMFNIKDTMVTPDQPIDSAVRSTLAQQYKKSSPVLFIVPRTAEADVAFAHLPTLNSPAASTIWITQRVNERCLSWISAHELGHVLLNSGRHSNGRVNVMSTGCTVNNWNQQVVLPRFTTAQCTALHQSPFFDQ